MYSPEEMVHSTTHKCGAMQKNIDAAGVETLNSSDKLYVVHVKQPTKDKDRGWSAGGPLLPGLEMALARYPHTIVELEVGCCVIMLHATESQSV